MLTGRTMALHGAPPALAARMEALGATLSAHGAPDGGAGSALGAPQTLVADTRTAFTEAGGGYEGVRAAVDGAFAAARDVAVRHWIDREGGGQVVLVAPAQGAGAHAAAARAALENLARTLSTEWARHAITTVAILPGDATGEEALADLVAWLATPAGAYLSGTALTLDRG